MRFAMPVMAGPLRNGVVLIHMLLDCAPSWLVCTESYARLRSWFSLTPERFRNTDGKPRWQQLVSRHTELCIDGCQGSGNTFVAFSVREALHKNLQENWTVVSHMHQLSQLKRALAFGVPTVVLVRDPYGACTSLKSRRPQLLDWVLLLRWTHYHRFVARHSRQLCLVFFEDFVTDIDLVRRVCPAIQRMAKAPLVAAPVYRNASAQRVPIRAQGFIARALLRSANQLYCDLRAVGVAAQAEMQPAARLGCR